MYLFLNVLTNSIINSYFNDSGCLIIFNNKLNSVDYFGKLPQVIVNTDRDVNPNLIFNYYGCQGFVIVNKRPITLFTTLEAAIKLTNNRFNFRKYLFLPVEDSRENLLDIFETGAINYVHDVLVIIPRNYTKAEGIVTRGNIIFDLFTHKYMGYENVNEATLLDRWFSQNQSFLYNNVLFPDKLENQFGRVFKIATFTYKPYSVADPPDGTEILFALEYARKHNMTPQLVIDEKAEWGDIFDNWTGTGILGNVVMDNSDVGLGALYTWEHEYRFLDLSKPMSRTGITCIAPAPTLMGGWITPFVSFNSHMWFALGVSFMISTFSIFIVTTYDISSRKPDIDINENINKSLLVTGAMFLLQAISAIPTNIFARLAYGLMMLLTLMLATLYGSGLSSNMTAPRYHGTISTAQDLAKADISWGATSTAWISSITGDTEPTYKTLRNSFIYTPGENLKALNEKKFAFSVERLPGGNFAIGNYVSKKGARIRRLMDEDIYWEYCVMMTRKSSILLPSINAMILRISQTGIPKYWEYQVVTRHLDTKIQKIVKYSSHTSRGSEPIQLQWIHVEGAFGIWSIGMGLAVLAFLIEKYLHKKKIKFFSIINKITLIRRRN